MLRHPLSLGRCAHTSPSHKCSSHHRTAQHSRGRVAASSTPVKEPALNANSTRVLELVAELERHTWRPHKDDVDRISRGGFARTRGTGSRDIPHRLNASERPMYEGAKKKGYLAVRGTSYRRERKGNPLPNIYRQWCDAHATATIVVEQDLLGSDQGTVVIDLATLRLPPQDLEAAKAYTASICAGVSDVAAARDRPPEAVPFNILPVGTSKYSKKHPTKISQEEGSEEDEEQAEQGVLGGEGDSLVGSYEGEEGSTGAGLEEGSSDGPANERAQQDRASVGVGESEAWQEQASAGSSSSGSSSGAQRGPSSPGSMVSVLQEQVAQAAARTRDLKEGQGLGNKDPAVQQSVAELLRLKAELEDAQMAAAAEQRRANPSPRLSTLYSAFGEGASSQGDVASPEPSTGGIDEDVGGALQIDRSLGRMSAVQHRQKARQEVVATWQMPAVPLFYVGTRSAAKSLAKLLAGQLIVQRVMAAISTQSAGH